MFNRLKRWMTRKNTLSDDPIQNTLIGNLLVVTDHYDIVTSSTINYVSKTYLKDWDITVYRLYTNFANYAELYYQNKTFVVGAVVSGDPTQSTPLMTFTQTIKEMGGLTIDSVCYNSFNDTTCLDTIERVWTDATLGASYTNTRFKDWTYCLDTTDNYTVVTQDNTRMSVLTIGNALIVGAAGFQMVKNLDTNRIEVTLSSKPHRLVDTPGGRRGIRELTHLLRIPDGEM